MSELNFTQISKDSQILWNPLACLQAVATLPQKAAVWDQVEFDLCMN